MRPGSARSWQCGHSKPERKRMASRYLAHAPSSGKRRWKSGSDLGNGRLATRRTWRQITWLYLIGHPAALFLAGVNFDSLTVFCGRVFGSATYAGAKRVAIGPGVLPRFRVCGAETDHGAASPRVL